MSSSSKSESGGAARVLVVDDDPTVLKLIGVLLDREGLDSTLVESGEEALLQLDTNLFELLIIDKNLPGLDGMQLARIVHLLSPDVPILLVTGYASTESAREAAALGITDYIPKPIDADEFCRVVSENLRSSSPVFSSAQLRFGTTFPPGTLPVVLARLSSHDEVGGQGEEKVDLALLSGHRVLVIEGDAKLRQELVAILGIPECRVDAFESVEAAAEHAELHGFDLLVATPDGLSRSAQLSAASPRATRGCIAIAERDDLDEIVEAIRAGARGLIAPPFAASRVFREISRVLRGLDDERLARSSNG
jgi:DNA-binding NtrC family response regulator